MKGGIDEDSKQYYLKRFRILLVALTCHVWTVSCHLEKISEGGIETTDITIRMRLMSSRLLEACSKLILDPADGATLESFSDWVNYVTAELEFQDIFPAFGPIYAWVSAYDKNARMEGMRANHGLPGKIFALKHLQNNVSMFENRVLDVFRRFRGFSDNVYLFCCVPRVSDAEAIFEQPPSEIVALDYAMMYQILNPLSKPPPFEKMNFTYQKMQVVVVGKPSDSFSLYFEAVKVPQIEGLSLRCLDRPLLQKFEHKKTEPRLLSLLGLILLYIATFAEPECLWFSSIFEGTHTDAEKQTAGRLLFRDKQSVSMAFGRRKTRQLYLFEGCMIISRPRAPRQIILEMIPLNRLLLVVYQHMSEHGCAGILTVYWKQDDHDKQEVCSADIFFDDIDSLVIWAGFLSLWTVASNMYSRNESAEANSKLHGIKRNSLSIVSTTSELDTHDDHNFKYLLDHRPLSLSGAIDQLVPELLSLETWDLHTEKGIKTILSHIGRLRKIKMEEQFGRFLEA